MFNQNKFVLSAEKIIVLKIEMISCNSSPDENFEFIINEELLPRGVNYETINEGRDIIVKMWYNGDQETYELNLDEKNDIYTFKSEKPYFMYLNDIPENEFMDNDDSEIDVSEEDNEIDVSEEDNEIDVSEEDDEIDVSEEDDEIDEKENDKFIEELNQSLRSKL